jgi:hypothetical protein
MSEAKKFEPDQVMFFRFYSLFSSCDENLVFLDAYASRYGQLLGSVCLPLSCRCRVRAQATARVLCSGLQEASTDTLHRL